MLKNTIALFVGLLISLPAIATEEPQSPNSLQSNSPNFDDGDLICFMQTIDGRTLNLSRMCGSNVRSGDLNVNSATTQPISSLGGLEAYRRPAGSPQCFGLDAQGQPCPPTASFN